jgi:hypothetical protein
LLLLVSMRIYLKGEAFEARLRFVKHIERWAIDVDGATISLGSVQQLGLKVDDATAAERALLASNGIALPPLADEALVAS